MFDLYKKRRITTSIIVMMISLLGAADQAPMILPDEAPVIRDPIADEPDVAVIIGPNVLFYPVFSGYVEVDALNIQVSINPNGIACNETQDSGISICSEVRILSEGEVASVDDLPLDFENVPRVVIRAAFEDGYPRCILRIYGYPDELDKKIVFAKVVLDGKALLVPGVSIDPSIVWDPEKNNDPVDGIYPRDRLSSDIEITLISGISDILPSNTDLPARYVLAMEYSPLYGKPDKFREGAVYDACVVEESRC